MACETDHLQRLQLKSSIAIAFIRRTFSSFGATDVDRAWESSPLDSENQGKPKVGDVQGHPMLVGNTGFNPLTNEV